jgi:hypothetical protein
LFTFSRCRRRPPTTVNGENETYFASSKYNKMKVGCSAFYSSARYFGLVHTTTKKKTKQKLMTVLTFYNCTVKLFETIFDIYVFFVRCLWTLPVRAALGLVESLVLYVVIAPKIRDI